jgi:hypothetical protein
VTPLVRKVDHVFVPVKDPEPLFSLFTDTLGMPVAWPVTDRGLYRSGAFCAGNANVEFLTADALPFSEPTEPLSVRGIALEPESAVDSVARLDERGLPHGEASTWMDDDGSPFVTNVFLSGFVADAAMVFLCRYEGATVAARREVFEAFDGEANPIGVRAVAEITVGVRDIDKAMESWRPLLAPVVPDDHGAFRLEEGPVIRLRRSPIDGVAAIWLEVASLARARDALRERDLLGPMRASGIGLNYAKTGGLDVWLSEKR